MRPTLLGQLEGVDLINTDKHIMLSAHTYPLSNTKPFCRTVETHDISWALTAKFILKSLKIPIHHLHFTMCEVIKINNE